MATENTTSEATQNPSKGRTPGVLGVTPSKGRTPGVLLTASPKGRVFRGTVVSTKMQDTIAVAVERYVKHPKYKKYLRRTKKFLVHDKGNTAKDGDVVEIREVRPISKRKRFELVK